MIKSPILAGIMRKEMTLKYLFLLAFSLVFSVSYGQAIKPGCLKYAGGTFLEIIDTDALFSNGKDTLIVFRGLQYWIEADVKHHSCIVYKIKWDNPCRFLILFNDGFIQNKSRKLIGSNIDYSSDKIDSNSISYIGEFMERSSHNRILNRITLQRINDTNAWQFLTDADTLLYNDTTEIKKLYGLPEQIYNYNVPDFIKSITDSSGMGFMQYIFSLLEAGNINPVYRFASPLMKRSSNDSMFSDYNIYVQHAFGKLENYEVASYNSTISAIPDQPRVDDYILSAKFAKVKQRVELCISIAINYPAPLVRLNVIADSAKQVTFIDSITADFWLLLKKHDFKNIYDNSSTLLRKKVSYAGASKILSAIFNRGYLANYKLNFETFSVIENKGYIDAEYISTIPGKTSTVTLLYSLQKGQYKLVALNDSER